MTSTEEVEQRLDVGHEARAFEVKGPGDIGDGKFVAKIARAAMAMANLRDGGQICIGIDDKDLAGKQPGLSAEQVAGWMDYDTMSAKLARYSDPPVTLRPHHLTLSNGVEVVVLEVEQFDRQPHVCKKAFQGELADGQTYVRPRGKPESVPVPNAAEMRELLDLAVDIGVREFMRRASVAGIALGPVAPAQPSDDALYDAEYEQAWPT